MKHKILCSILFCLCFALPACAEFAALERDLTNGSIIYDVTPTSYTGNDGIAITEQTVFEVSGSGYEKTGLTADGNTRLILRYQSEESGVVTFSAQSYVTLEKLTDRSPLASSTQVSTVQVGDKYQASAVLIAPETFPSELEFSSGEFKVTANFTSDDGITASEELTLTLKTPTVVLLHGLFTDNTKTFGTNAGIWPALKKASFDVVGVNYDWSKAPSALISYDNNIFVRNFTDIFDGLNQSGIASTRVDLKS